MRAEQRVRRDAIWNQFVSGRRSVSRSFGEILSDVERIASNAVLSHIELITDEKPQYQKVISRAAKLSAMQKRGEFVHVMVSGKAARTKNNRLFAVNYLDREIRKDNANHVRETVQFSRNVNSCMERLAIYRLYHNYLKPYRIAPGKRELRTHTEVAGAAPESVRRELADAFSRRRLLSRSHLAFSDALIWLRALSTPGIASPQACPSYAWD